MTECTGYRSDRQFTECRGFGFKSGLPAFFKTALHHINNLLSRRIVSAAAAANLFAGYTEDDIPQPLHFFQSLPERYRIPLCRICRQSTSHRCFQ